MCMQLPLSMFFLFTIYSTWKLPMRVCSFVIVIGFKAPFAPWRNVSGFIVQHLKLMLILPPVPWNKVKLLNASWKWLWVTLIIKIAFLGATWYEKCLLEMVLLVRAGWGWAGCRNGAGPGNMESLWSCSEVLSLGFCLVHTELSEMAQWPRAVPTWVSALSYTGFRAARDSTCANSFVLDSAELHRSESKVSHWWRH